MKQFMFNAMATLFALQALLSSSLTAQEQMDTPLEPVIEELRPFGNIFFEEIEFETAQLVDASIAEATFFGTITGSQGIHLLKAFYVGDSDFPFYGFDDFGASSEWIYYSMVSTDGSDGIPIDGLAFELKHLKKHLPNTPESDREIRNNGSAHVFTDLPTLSRVMDDIINHGTYTGTDLDGRWERYGLMFEDPIGVRIDEDGSTIPLHYGEIKLDPRTGLFHVIPRTRPRK